MDQITLFEYVLISIAIVGIVLCVWIAMLFATIGAERDK